MTDSKRELHIERTFDAPVELVFKAWTDPELLAKWWGPIGVTIPVSNMDVRPGGHLEIVMLAGEELGNLKGSEWPMTGVYEEIVPLKKLVYTSSAMMAVGSKPMIEATNTVTFEDLNGKTKLTFHTEVSKATAEAEGPLAGMETGWNQSIDKLAKLLES